MPTYYSAVHDTPRLHPTSVLIAGHQLGIPSSVIRNAHLRELFHFEQISIMERGFMFVSGAFSDYSLLNWRQMSMDCSQLNNVISMEYNLWVCSTRFPNVFVSCTWARIQADVTCMRDMRNTFQVSWCTNQWKKSIISRVCCYRWLECQFHRRAGVAHIHQNRDTENDRMFCACSVAWSPGRWKTVFKESCWR